MVAHFLPTLCDENTTPEAAVTNVLRCLLFSVKTKETKDSFSTDVGVETYAFNHRTPRNIAGNSHTDTLRMFRNAGVVLQEEFYEVCDGKVETVKLEKPKWLRQAVLKAFSGTAAAVTVEMNSHEQSMGTRNASGRRRMLIGSGGDSR